MSLHPHKFSSGFMAACRQGIRDTELDCASWPDEVLNELVLAVLGGSMGVRFEPYKETTEHLNNYLSGVSL